MGFKTLRRIGKFVAGSKNRIKAFLTSRKGKQLVASGKVKSGKATKFGTKGFASFRRKQKLIALSKNKGVRAAGKGLALGGAFVAGGKIRHSRKKSKSRK